ncbi:MAG TPA: Bax inhibitor-1/YccA family protein [Stellaceae bacterium]|nr:Bax inhibitor-1/YccA family protein [Stellaceae bacterium]
MAYGSQNPWSVNRGAAASQADIDQGLRQYMLRVYNYMASGLALTGVVSWLAYSTGFYASIAGTPLMWIVMLAPIALVFFFSFKLNSMSFGTAQTVFWLYAGLMGLSLAGIFQVYTGASIARVFFITAGTFAGTSLWGYTTKTDLTRMGSFMMMGLIGIVIASLVNIFLASPAVYFAISIIGVVVFVGLTAYDTQKIREMYLESDFADVMGKKALMGALTLYLDFVNLFLMLLRFFGDRRN